LVRALAELATTSHHSATWLPGARVAVPLRLIADKWIEYYWPLIESSEFIPQKRGEKPDCTKPMKFRAPLARLVEHYRNRGGLAGFTVDYRSRGLSEEAAKVHGQALSKVRDAIREGPVYFAGGGGSGTFRYDSASGRVEMAADLWRELSLMGAWIADATVLRWAELTAEISQGSLKPSQVIDALLTVPLAERDVHAARKLYDDLDDKVCVWTGVLLGGRFELDHAIPFALWRNNDLWNLLPASKTANQDKRDRLPSRSVLSSRQSCIIDYWSRMRGVHAERFDFEAERLAGRMVLRSGDWELRLFGALAESVEHTAIQRGVERWEPRGFRTMVSGWAAEDRSAPEPQSTSPNASGPVLLGDPPVDERFILWVPFYELAVAAGAFGPEQTAPDPRAASAWARVEGIRAAKDMFALRVVGHSMEPKIPDGSLCLFRGGEALAGTRQGRIVLVALRDSVDPETAGRLTVKQYWSEKRFDEEGNLQHVRIELRPLNPDFAPIVITQAEEESLQVMGEWIGLIRQSS
jgi:SOS-response transcriptional repressor LexA